jgi:hypothetical protein
MCPVRDWWGGPAIYSGAGARISSAAAAAIALIWRAHLASACWRAIVQSACTLSARSLSTSTSRTVCSMGVAASGRVVAMVSSGIESRFRWRFSVGAMATDLSSVLDGALAW